MIRRPGPRGRGETYDVLFEGRPVGVVEPLNGGWAATDLEGDVEFRGSLLEAAEHLAAKVEARVANRARREHRDLVTGARAKPGAAGSVETGLYVMRLRPEKGEPFEVVEVEREDLDPTRDMLGMAAKTRPYYVGQARTAARGRKRFEKEQERRLKRLEAGRVKGVKASFASARKGAEELFQQNIDFYEPILDADPDPGDYLDRWFDTNEVKVGRRWRRLRETKRGQELERLHYENFGKEAILQSLAYILGKARARRWDAVDWNSIETYNDALIRAYESRREQGWGESGATAFQLPYAARGLPKEIEAMQADPELRQQFSWLDARDELRQVADRLEEAYKRNRKCIGTEARKTIRERIKQFRAWSEDPALVPGFACISDAVYCRFPAAWREVEEVRAACETDYDPEWPLKLSDREALDLGVLPPEEHIGRPREAPAAAAAPEPELDLPWEQPAANPRRLKRRLLR